MSVDINVEWDLSFSYPLVRTERVCDNSAELNIAIKMGCEVRSEEIGLQYTHINMAAWRL